MPREYKRKDRTGDKVGRLTVLRELCKNDKGRWEWLCLCDCGNEHIVAANSLSNGNIQSCGCAQRERKPRTCVYLDKNTEIVNVVKQQKSTLLGQVSSNAHQIRTIIVLKDMG